MKVVHLLAVTGVTSALLVPLAASAEAASWTGNNSSGVSYELCTPARTYNKVAYVSCIQYKSGRNNVRTVIRVHTTAKRKVTGYPYIRINGRSHNLSAPNCSATLASGVSRQCSTSWLSATRITQLGQGDVTVAGHKVATMRVRGMHFSGKKQENSAKYCGPASVQAAIWTEKGSAPSQSTLANSSNLQTNSYGFTPPTNLKKVLNKYKPSSVAKYSLYDFGSTGQSTELAFKQIYKSIEAGNAVVYLVDPSQLPWSSNPNGTSVRHYIMLHGYSAYKTSSDTNLNGGWVSQRFSAFDPADGKVHTISAIQLINAAQAAEYIDDDLVFAAK